MPIFTYGPSNTITGLIDPENPPNPLIIPKNNENSMTPIGYIGSSAFFNNSKIINVQFESGSLVFSIGSNAFRGCNNMLSITIPDRPFTTIGTFAFQGCTKLTQITIPTGVTTIQSSTFSGCTLLNTVIINATNLQTIASSAFFNCNSLANINIPNTVTTIGTFAFQSCSKLPQITIPTGVQIINNYTFANCISLSTVIINATNLQNIYVNAFFNCISLANINIPNTVTTIETGAFLRCSKLTQITIPTGVQIINASTFADCTLLNTVTINATNLQIIADNAFYNCISLANINIPNTVTTIETGAFLRCSKLTQITIPTGVQIINASTFADCTLLNTVTINATNLQTIADNAFYNCNSIQSITLPNSLTTIADNAFYNCNSIQSITLPNSLTTIDINAFAYCTSLQNITIDKNNSLLENINSGAFEGCISLTSLILPNSLKIIGNFAFSICSFTTINIPQNVITIGIAPFTSYPLISITVDTNNTNFKVHNSNNASILYDKTRLIQSTPYITGSYTMLDTIDNGANYISIIDEYAFRYCNNLTNINFSNHITTLLDFAFYETGITSIILIPSITEIQNAFADCKINKIINNSPYFKFDTTTTNTTGKVLYNSTYTHLVLTETTFKGEYVILPGTQIINASAFAYSGLTDITIPNTITQIFKSSFTNCPLKNITNTQSKYCYVQNINGGQILYNLFYNVIVTTTINLSGEITIPEYITFESTDYNILIINNYAFANRNINKINISKNIIFINSNTFLNTKLTDITLDSQNDFLYLDITQSGKILYDNQFRSIIAITINLSNTYTILSKITINNITYPIFRLFDTFSNIKISKLIIPESIRLLFQDTFTNMPNIKSITFNGNAPNVIANRIFFNDPSLTYIYYYLQYRNTWNPRPWWIPGYIQLIEIGTNNTQLYINQYSLNGYLIQNNKIYKVTRNINNIGGKNLLTKPFYLQNQQQLLQLFIKK